MADGKGKTMAVLGGIPPGKRLIEYSYEYSKTYRNTYYQVVDEDWAEELEHILPTLVVANRSKASYRPPQPPTLSPGGAQSCRLPSARQTGATDLLT